MNFIDKKKQSGKDSVEKNWVSFVLSLKQIILGATLFSDME